MDKLTDSMQGWRIAALAIPREGPGFTLWTDSVDEMESMGDSQIKKEYLEIAGDFFTPGKRSGFLLYVDVQKEDFFELSFSGPLAKNRHIDMSGKNILELARMKTPIYSRTLSGAEISEAVDDLPELADKTEILAEEIAAKILEALDWQAQKGEE